jgi:SAM-dependent methyltransferase
MMNCRLCDHAIDDAHAIVLDVPAGTQLFSDNAATALALKARISIVECPECSLIQLTGHPVAYEHVSSSSSFVSSHLTDHRLEQLRELFRMRPDAEGSGRLLEIGCGDGHLLQHAQGMFQHMVGVEPTKRNADVAAARSLDIHQMLMGRDVVVPGGPFQYFCSFHVLEHVTQVRSVLQGIAKALDAEGVGIVEVPSTEAAIENRRFGDFMPDHLNYFTERTLRTALEWSGFTVERIFRNWGNEHLVAYVRKRSSAPSLAYIADRQAQIDALVAQIGQRQLPFAVWGVSHHLMPYIPALARIQGLLAIDGSSSKVGKYIPSTNIPVRPISALRDVPHGYVAVTAPRFKAEIMAELSRMYGTVVEDTGLTERLGFEVFECRLAAQPRA